MHPSLATQNCLSSMRSGLPWSLGSEMMNHAGIRIFQHHLDASYFPRPITVGMNLRLVPVGVAYVLDTNATALGPGCRDPAHVRAATPVAAQNGVGGRTRARTPERGRRSCGASARPSPPTSAWSGPSTGHAACTQYYGARNDRQNGVPLVRGSIGAVPGPPRKRRYCEYSEGEATLTDERAGIPDGWHKCSCCVSGWYYVDDGEENECLDVCEGTTGGRGMGSVLDRDVLLDYDSDSESQITNLTDARVKAEDED